MGSNRLAFVALGFACLVAAAGGGYLATRQNAVEQVSVAAATLPVEGQASLAAAAPSKPSASKPVLETEAVVGDSVKRSEPVAAPSAPASPAKSSATARPSAQLSKGAKPANTVARNTPLPTLQQSWPSGAGSAAQEPAAVSSGTSQQDATAPAARQEEPSVPELGKTPETERVPEKTFQELVVAADSVIGLQLETTLTSERARVEDRVEARVIRDVRVGSQVAIPAGAHAIGSVMEVDRGGKFKKAARLGIRFHTLVLADGTRLPIATATIYRSGEEPGNSSAAKIGGGAVGGAILGAILGGAKGAAIGAAAGAGGGAAVTAAGDPSVATFPTGTQLTARFLSPVTVTVDK